MITLNTLIILSAAFLMTAAIGTARAENGDMTQTQTHDRSQAHLNFQASDTDFTQSLNREQNRTMNQNQNQYQYKYMNDAAAEHGGVGSGMSRSIDRYSQNSAMSGSMNRQSATTRSMGGGRR